MTSADAYENAGADGHYVTGYKYVSYNCKKCGERVDEYTEAQVRELVAHELITVFLLWIILHK